MPKLLFQQKIVFLGLAAGLPGVAISLILLWAGDFTLKVQWTLTLLIVTVWLSFAFLVRERVIRPLQTISNLLAALREGDYSIRAYTRRPPQDLLAEVGVELSALEHVLRHQRLGAVEASALVRRVIEVIDVAIFAFDHEGKLRLVNRAGERLLARPAERLMGRSAESLGLADCLAGENRTIRRNFPGKNGRWALRRGTFREGGLPHQLLALADLSQALREEERQAWQRLVRVLGHELNNSLTPIKSMAGSLSGLLKKDPLPGDWRQDMTSGLNVINSRADALARFVDAYARLARLPQPSRREVELAPLIRRVAGLETRMDVQVSGGPEVNLSADADQLEQLLINLLKNAVDAALETGGEVDLDWSVESGRVSIRIRDEGPGLISTANLFVPFFTTKPGGSGIGLLLCRQIAEAHGGVLKLDNRGDRNGCEAILELPCGQPAELSRG